jgi:putative ABC transport system ATP-binding protein
MASSEAPSAANIVHILPGRSAATVGRARQVKRVLVRVENVSKEYRLDNQLVPALRNINLNIDQGVFMAVAGPSGSGKSTLLNLIGCIDTPTTGRIFIGENDVSGKSPDQLAALRARTIGFIFQTFNLLPVLSAEENVEYPLLQFKELSTAERRRRVQRYLKVVGLSDFARHRPNQLSGGQRQRVAIARALVVHPKIILADEPTANLDHKTGGRILRLMRRINRKMHTTFVFSTHDQRVIDMAIRRVDLEDGEIVRLGVREGKEWVYAMERLNDSNVDSEEDDG